MAAPSLRSRFLVLTECTSFRWTHLHAGLARRTNIAISLIYEVIGLVNRKICTHLLLDPGRLSRAPARTFISTLDSLPGSLTIERGNEAQRSGASFLSGRVLFLGFCFLSSEG